MCVCACVGLSLAPLDPPVESATITAALCTENSTLTPLDNEIGTICISLEANLILSSALDMDKNNEEQ